MKANKQYYQIARKCAEQRDDGCDETHCNMCPYNIYGYFPKKPNKALRHLVSAYTDYMEAKEATLWSVVGKTIWAGLQLIGLFWLFFTVKGCFGG